MSRINTVPRGLQSFLGNTNMGDNPSELSPVAAGVVNLERFLAIDRMRSISSGGTVIPAGSGRADVFSITVPDNKLWMLVHVGMHIDKAGGGGQGFLRTHVKLTNYPAYEGAGNPGGQIVLASCGSNDQVSNPSRDIGWAETFPNPIPLPAGVTLTWRAGDNFDSVNDSWTVVACGLYFELDT